MTEYFADTSYYIALLSPTDEAHEKAMSAVLRLRGRIVTTEWVLAEVGNSLSAPPNRGMFVSLLRDSRRNRNVVVIPSDRHLFEAGVELYASRLDKAWSVVDCISFCVMTERGLTDALSTDHHFEQAGFRLLLK